MKERIFLTAEWRKLIMANYIIEPDLLQQYLPPKTEIDTWNNNCYLSLVGFLFKEVTVKGIKIPFHVNFPEVNLRFYVKVKEGNEWKRGVVFLKEIVPKPAISFVANTLYHEHYATMPVRHRFEIEKEQQQITYQWKKGGKWNSLAVAATSAAQPLQQGSEEEFITEHFWGYTKVNEAKTAAYQVAHPRWDINPVQQFTIDCDFEKLYGKSFSFLQSVAPASVFLAEGSPIKVFTKKML
jgi:uncharacterized protein